MDSRQRLEQVVRKKIGKKAFVIVSHSEPYVHYYEEGEVNWRKAGGGLVTALDPVMQTCGGTWVAFAAGDADLEAVDSEGKLKVPPDNPCYTLKRVALDKDDVAKYLDGVSHSSLWPWCHFAYVRPAFKDERWPSYRKVNNIFADSVIECIGDSPAFVWVHDYHLSLVAKYIKEKRPEVVTAHFWHVPWPNVEVFKVCPWGQEMIEAMLYNDLIGFQIRYYANNFLDSVDQTLQARVDRELSTVFYKESQTLIKDFAISIDAQGVKKASEAVNEQKSRQLRKHYGLVAEKIVCGIDRLDYGKGLAEKLMVMDEFFKQNPDWVGRLTLVQLASPTRSQVPAYKANAEKVLSLVDEVNYQWSKGKWKPVVFINDFLSYDDVISMYKLADCCLITSMHDGMNLVSKEFVSAKQDGNGTLVLSKFTGASRELKEAVLINPYAIADTASALKQALEMPLEERRRRLARMAQEVTENNVYEWAANFIEHIAKLESTVV